jgi:hypothetical protein
MTTNLHDELDQSDELDELDYDESPIIPSKLKNRQDIIDNSKADVLGISVEEVKMLSKINDTLELLSKSVKEDIDNEENKTLIETVVFSKMKNNYDASLKAVLETTEDITSDAYQVLLNTLIEHSEKIKEYFVVESKKQLEIPEEANSIASENSQQQLSDDIDAIISENSQQQLSDEIPEIIPKHTQQKGYTTKPKQNTVFNEIDEIPSIIPEKKQQVVGNIDAIISEDKQQVVGNIDAIISEDEPKNSNASLKMRKPLDLVFTKEYQKKLIQQLSSNVLEAKVDKELGIKIKYKPNSIFTGGLGKKQLSATMIDSGHSLAKTETANSDNKTSAREMIKLVKTKGWSNITIQSTNKEFEAELVKMAKTQKITVRIIESTPNPKPTQESQVSDNIYESKKGR